MAHLAGPGRRRIAAVGIQSTAAGVTAWLRLQGYLRGLAGAGLAVDPDLIVPADAWHRAQGADAARALLAGGVEVDAVLCFNSTCSPSGCCGAWRRRRAGARRDVAVVGVDDVEDARHVLPSLSTVALETQQIAETAVDLLAARIDGDRVRPHRHRRPPAGRQGVQRRLPLIESFPLSTADQGR